jgi:hypothetical protein
MPEVTKDYPDIYDVMQRVSTGELRPTGEMRDLCQGIAWRRSSRDFCVIKLHYTADPRKRSEEWKGPEKRQAGERGWFREYEMHWIVHEGVRVFPQYFRDKHRNEAPLEPWPGIPIIRGWDVGPTNRWLSAVALQVNKNKETRVLREWLENDVSLTDFTESVTTESVVSWGDNAFRDSVDAHSFGTRERLTSNQLASVDILKQNGVRNPRKAMMNMKVREDTVIKHLQHLSPSTGEASYQHDPSCIMLENGFLGGYHRRKSTRTGEPMDIIEKNEYSHVHDAHQFALIAASALSKTLIDVEDEEAPLEPVYADYEIY